MSKPERLTRHWELLSLVTGGHKENCGLLNALTGLEWVCRRLVDEAGVSDIRYAVRKGPSAQAGYKIVDVLNDQLFAGRKMFEVMGDSEAVIAANLDVVQQILAAHPDDFKDVCKNARRAMVRMNGVCLTEDLLVRVQRSSLQTYRDFKDSYKPF